MRRPAEGIAAAPVRPAPEGAKAAPKRTAARTPAGPPGEPGAKGPGPPGDPPRAYPERTAERLAPVAHRGDAADARADTGQGPLPGSATQLGHATTAVARAVSPARG